MSSVPWNGKTIALDIGQVCISLHFDRCFRAFGMEPGAELNPEFLLACRKLAIGAIEEGAWLDLVCSLLGGRLSREQARDAWNQMLGPSLPGMKEAVETLLSKGYRFAYLSDTSTIHMAHFLRTNDFCHLVSGGVFSYEAGDEKPGAAMYESFERKYGVPCLYTDDKQCNIDGALKRGWRAELFTSPAKFLESALTNPP